MHAWERLMGISVGRSTSPASQSLTAPSVLVARARVGLAPRGCRDTSCGSALHTRFLHATAVHAAVRTALPPPSTPLAPQTSHIRRTDTPNPQAALTTLLQDCLLYTSDAADE